METPGGRGTVELGFFILPISELLNFFAGDIDAISELLNFFAGDIDAISELLNFVAGDIDAISELLNFFIIIPPG